MGTKMKKVINKDNYIYKWRKFKIRTIINKKSQMKKISNYDNNNWRKWQTNFANIENYIKKEKL